MYCVTRKLATLILYFINMSPSSQSYDKIYLLFSCMIFPKNSFLNSFYDLISVSAA